MAARPFNPVAERRRNRKVELQRLEEERVKRLTDEERRKEWEAQHRMEEKRLTEEHRLAAIKAAEDAFQAEKKRLRDIEQEERDVVEAIESRLSAHGGYTLDRMSDVPSPVAICCLPAIIKKSRQSMLATSIGIEKTPDSSNTSPRTLSASTTASTAATAATAASTAATAATTATTATAAATTAAATAATATATATASTDPTSEMIFISSGATHSIRCYTRDRAFLFAFGSEGCEKGQFAGPVAMCATRWNQLLVVEKDNHRVQIFNAKTLYQAWSTGLSIVTSVAAVFGQRGSKPGEFLSPRGIAVDDVNGDIYIADQMNHRIQVFTGFSDLNRRPTSTNSFPTFLREFGRKECLSTSPSKANLNVKSKVSVESKVSFESPSKAKLLESNKWNFGEGDGKDGLCRPMGLALSWYHVVVSDTGNARMAIFTKEGKLVITYGTRGTRDVEFMDVRDVILINVEKVPRSNASEKRHIISNEKFEMVIADLGNFRLQILNQDGELVRLFSLFQDYDQFLKSSMEIKTKLVEVMRLKSKVIPPHLQRGAWDCLADYIHPSCPAYQKIQRSEFEYRQLMARMHHPVALMRNAYNQFMVCDEINSKVYVYSTQGITASSLLKDKKVQDAMNLKSVTSICLNANETYMGLIDGDSHSVFVVSLAQASTTTSTSTTTTTTTNVRLIGASSYGHVLQKATSGYLPGELNDPQDIAMGWFNKSCTTECILVSDAGNHRIQFFDVATGSFVGGFGTLGHFQGSLHFPCGLALFENDTLFLTDKLNHRVQVFLWKTGECLRSFGRMGTEAGAFQFPSALAVCGNLAVAPPHCSFGLHYDSKVAVSDTGNHRIQVFDLQGNIQFVIGLPGTELGRFCTPLGIDIEARSGCILVTDSGNGRVLIFRRNGDWLHSFGQQGATEVLLHRPVSVRVSKRHDVYVADAHRMDVLKFECFMVPRIPKSFDPPFVPPTFSETKAVDKKSEINK